jgi:hypothetical protein
VHTPVVGDWNGDNIDTIGVYVNGVGKWAPGTVDGIGVLN